MKVETGYVAEATVSKYKSIKTWGLVFGALAFFLLLIGVTPIVSLFILIAIISMYPMKYIEWLGIELCMFFTVLTSMFYGPVVGVLVGKVANTVGVILAEQLDQNIVFDFVSLIAVAVIAAMFPPEYITVVGIGLLLMYHAGYVLYNKALETFDSDNMLYVITNILFNIAIFWRLGPVFVRLLA